MSLLMEALKKAEEAKHRTEAQGDVEPATPSDSVQTEREGLDAELELELNEAYLDTVARGPRAQAEPSAVAPTKPSGPTQPDLNPVAAHQRWAARTIFVAKESDGHYRHLIVYGLAVVLAVVVAGVYHVGMTDSSGANATAPRVAVAPAPEVDAAPAADEQPPDELPPPVDEAVLRAVLQQPARGASDEIAPPEDTASTPATAITISRRELTPRVDTLIDDAYAAYRRGDSRTAHGLYWQVLRADANNRNALLGLAAIAARNDEQAQAREFYLRLLDRDPNDPLALAGLLNLEEAADPRAQESRVKSLLAQHPQAAHLHAALGNLYAREERWSEAQAAYAQALALDERDALRPEYKNPDFAFNLAVSLEHLGQTATALNHYRAALGYAQHRRPDFDPAVVQARIRALAVD